MQEARKNVVLLGLAAFVLLAGCGGSTAPAEGPTPVTIEVPGFPPPAHYADLDF